MNDETDVECVSINGDRNALSMITKRENIIHFHDLTLASLAKCLLLLKNVKLLTIPVDNSVD